MAAAVASNGAWTGPEPAVHQAIRDLEREIEILTGRIERVRRARQALCDIVEAPASVSAVQTTQESDVVVDDAPEPERPLKAKRRDATRDADAAIDRLAAEPGAPTSARYRVLQLLESGRNMRAVDIAREIGIEHKDAEEILGDLYTAGRLDRGPRGHYRRPAP